MFAKVLVCNRGEIAVRLLRTLREMSVPSVAVYSDADRSAAHWRFADEAYALGDSAPSKSYLDIQKLLDVATQCGADAVLPGYGFLSENAEFASACEAKGIRFVGPSSDVIREMGAKEKARERMMQAGVPVVPGGPAGTLEEARRSATRIGYPLLIKAALGGGGRGMRLVEHEGELPAQFELARSESKRAFGSEQVYLEKWIQGARHVEVQVLGDTHGNVVHLFERDCSIQRRHQKLVEETPCPELDDSVREALTEAAVSGARGVGYYSAGTFEFLLADDGNFYFIEMNTRLQVEHTVTEMVTGIDLVRSMLRIAAGESLDLNQGDIQRHGVAMQCRVCAENPFLGFTPGAGTITSMEEPSGPFIRLDSGIRRGQPISTFYDSLLAKLCAWAPSRAELIPRLRRALDELSIGGVETNLEFHRRLLRDPDFSAGRYDTAFIERHPELMALRPVEQVEHVAALVAERHFRDQKATALEPTRVDAWALASRPSLPRT